MCGVVVGQDVYVFVWVEFFIGCLGDGDYLVVFKVYCDFQVVLVGYVFFDCVIGQIVGDNVGNGIYCGVCVFVYLVVGNVIQCFVGEVVDR